MINRFKFYTSILILLQAICVVAQHPQLQISDNGRFLSTKEGKAVFLNGDTGWNLARSLNRLDAEHYISVRSEQGFNLLGVSAIHSNDPENFYGDSPFEQSSGVWDPSKPLISKGEKFKNALQYDYWDHLDYILELIEKYNMYVALVVCFNDWVVGSGDGSDRSQIVFNTENAYEYGYFLGNRYRKSTNILWMMGGDRSAVYGEHDYREVYRTMAEGCADGIKGVKNRDGRCDISGILMSFHPQKRHPNSSQWFHHDDWLTFNSIQACPSEQERLIHSDYTKNPVKPTWLFEGRYEHYTFAYKPWQVRFQAYLSVFAGGFGHVYGNEAIWDYDPSWKTDIYWDGGLHMKYMNHILTKGLDRASFGDLGPDTSIVANSLLGTTSTECWSYKTLEAPYSSRIAAFATVDYSTLLVYSADGSTIELYKEPLPESYAAYWYNPRTGRFSEKKEINHKTPLDLELYTISDSLVIFDLPGNPGRDNDWILLIESTSNNPAE